MIEGQEGVTWDDWVRLAALTEEHGLEGLFRSDHYTAIIRPDADAHDAWATLAGLAAVTGADPPRHDGLARDVPATRASSPGWPSRSTTSRAAASRWGWAPGWYEREHEAHGFPFLDGKRRFELFAEQVEVVVRSWTEERFDHDGPAYRLRDQRRSRGPCSSRTRRSSSAGRSSAASPRSPHATRPR